MSGIVGIVSGDHRPLESARLVAMTAALAFRGPDAQEVWSDGAVGLGHTLLRTTFEAQTEHQPLSLDGQVWIVADARVDARPELVSRLKTMAPPLNGQAPRPLEEAPDGELILRAYHAWGERCVEHLIGDFAFIIWDGRLQQLFCARDQYGVKQFYYAQAGTDLVLGNTLDCLRLYPGVSSCVNERAIGDFLLTDYNQEPQTTTFFRDIKVLPPAHTLTFKQGTLRLRNYWRAPEHGYIRYRGGEEYVEHLRGILATAVVDRLRTRRAGISLSGGLDSASVLALALEGRKRQSASTELVAGLTDYRPLLDDRDAVHAQLLADHFAVPLHRWSAAEQPLFPHWNNSARRLPEPINGLFVIHQVEMMHALASHTRVALNGFFGDSGFFPYRAYFLHLLRDGHLRQLVSDVGGYLLSHRRLPPLYFRTALRERAPHDIWKNYPRWLNSKLEQRLDLRQRWRVHLQADEPLHVNPAQRYQLAIYGHRMVINAFLDPGFTGMPIEPRSPYADLRVANFMLAIPPVPWRIDKEILRRAMRSLLPDSIRLRPKSITPDPTAQLIAGSQRSLLDLLAGAAALAEYVDLEQVRSSFLNSTASNASMNLRPFSLAMWLQRLERKEPSYAGEASAL